MQEASTDGAVGGHTARSPGGGSGAPGPDAGPSSDAPIDTAAGIAAAIERESALPTDDLIPPSVDELAESMAESAKHERADTAAGSPSRQGSDRATVVCVTNQKGGVGKTTTTISLGAALAEAGQDVLIVDLDPQGNATTGLGLRVAQGSPSTYQVIVEGMPVEDASEPTAVRGLHVLPSSLDLAGAEIELVPQFSREGRLKTALDDVRDLYDVVLVDCPPSLGLLTINALVAADQVLVPIQCEYYALEGLGQLMRTIELVRSNLNKSLELGGVLMTMFDARTNLSQQVVDEVRAHFGDLAFTAVIPRTVRLSEAPSYGQPITVFDPTSRGSLAYQRLAKELGRRLGLVTEPERSPLDDLLGTPTLPAEHDPTVEEQDDGAPRPAETGDPDTSGEVWHGRNRPADPRDGRQEQSWRM